MYWFESGSTIRFSKRGKENEMITYLITTESGSEYVVDTDNQVWKRNNGPEERLVDYRFYDLSWWNRPPRVKSHFTRDFTQAVGKYLHIEGDLPLRSGRAYDSTKIISVTALS